MAEAEKNIEPKNISSEKEEEKIWAVLREVCDPEIPVLSIIDLGVLRKVNFTADQIIITITPTYSGCPAMDTISMDIKMKLIENGYKNIKINTELSPAWSTDLMTEEGKIKLSLYGIAPPKHSRDADDTSPQCPQCASSDTKLLSQFGSTACKALYQCNTCKEPFDLFKCH